MKHLRNVLLVTTFAIVLAGLGCPGSNDVTRSGQGSLTVMVHDTVAPGITSAMVTFDSVQAVPADGSAAVEVGGLTDTPIDLVELVDGKELTLAADTLPAGDYTALRVTLTQVDLALDDGSTVSVTLGQGVAVHVPVQFTVVEGEETVISLDIPLGSFQDVNGQWLFNPSAVSAVVTG